MSELLIINGHPNPQSFSFALSAAYQDSASGLVNTTRINLRELHFDLVLRTGYEQTQPLEPDLQRAADAIVRAKHVAWFFPTWWNNVPALLKGFIDRVFTPGFAFAYTKGSPFPRKLLAGRSARLVTSMDGPWIWHKLVQRSAVHVALGQSTLGFSGFSPVRDTTFYGARRMTTRDRERALHEMKRVGEKDARGIAPVRLPALAR